MSLDDLSDPAAVRAAITEFDRIGREAFLAKYGIDKARGWPLVDGRDREYDAKAIAGRRTATSSHRKPLGQPSTFTEAGLQLACSGGWASPSGSPSVKATSRPGRATS